ncbi:hypothetical protein SAMN02745724_03722 [Pseudoalteromonas denitrificans DSM 6059]|uniref:Uncharacterized protein n=2 Tax=Pseudoalteromonas TaxID=53246 RepID=A0A1I1Q3V1_9GAMM|nr:hypothetical protein SAMN02745724_03722 [Pseudoalteromonas denitrificans DSM 6059]
MYTWNKDNLYLNSAIDGSIIPNDPRSGEKWANESVAMLWAEAEKVRAEAQALLLSSPQSLNYTGHIVFTSNVVNENTGTVLQAPNPEAEFSEMTITKNSVLKLVANIQSDKNDEATVLTDLPNDMFRIPIRNQDTAEQDLLLGTLDKGILTVEAVMDKAGYWEVTEALINSKLPDDFNLAMEKMVFAVVSVPKASMVDTTTSEASSSQAIESVSNAAEASDS